MTLLKAYRDVHSIIEKGLNYRFGDKERERSNRAAGLGKSERPSIRCYSIPVHGRIAWTGPPHDQVEAWVCLECRGVASAPEIKDRGFDFKDCPDWIIFEILDLDLQRQASGSIKTFAKR